MATQGFSGKLGTAYIDDSDGQKICDLGKWTFEPTFAVQKYASNCTGGFKDGVIGVGDSKGTLEVKIPKDGGKLPLHPGVEYTLQLHADATGDNYIKVRAAIAGMPIEVDINEGTPVGTTFAFEGLGEPEYNGIFEVGDSECCESDSSSGE